MPNQERSAIGRWLFGSVSEKVRRRSSVPVLFVPETQ
jgi:nucleotide-binding universal stress UspA family protein